MIDNPSKPTLRARMSQAIPLATMVALLAPTSPAAAPEGFHLTEAIGAFADVRQRFRDNESIEVVFIGGSNTIGNSSFPRVGVDPEHGAYDLTWYHIDRHSFRARTLKGLQVRYGQYPGQVVEVNAALGGTTSALASWRFQQDVLDGCPKPDLVIVEFVVNDVLLTDLDHTDDRAIPRNLTSIMQQIETVPTSVGVVFVINTLRGDVTHFENAVERRVGLARHEYLRFINEWVLARSSRRRDIAVVDAERLFFHRPIPDWVAGPLFLGEGNIYEHKHPSPFGHHLIAAEILDQIEDRVSGGMLVLDAPSPYPDTILPFPVQPKVVQPHQILANSVSTGFYVGPALDGTEIFSGDDVLYATGPGANLEYTFHGSGPLDFWVQKRYSGLLLNARIQVRVDDGPYLLFTDPPEPGNDANIGRYVEVANDLPNGRHTVQVTVLDGPNNGHDFKLGFHAFLRDAARD